jgi:DNA-binding NarL/FixJ family response regulator
MNELITIILADDHALVRDMLADWLRAQPDMRVVGTCASAEEALTAALQLAPDVVILDIDMPGQAAFEAARSIRAQLPDTHVIFLSAFFSDHYIGQALAVRASGYLTKGEPPETVANAVRDVRAGKVCFSPEVQARIVIDPTGVRLASTPLTRTGTLTARELEILRYLARALSRREIADTLHLSINTIDRHTANLMNKLDIHDRAELCRFAIREGLAEA